MKKRILSVFLSLCMISTLFVGMAVPAGAAYSYPTSALSGVEYYYGSRYNCKMPAEMAKAYADVLANQPSDTWTVLVDPAQDGFPLLLVGTLYYDRYEGYGPDSDPEVWTWNGTRAVAYDFSKDAECGYIDGIYFGRCDGYGALTCGDGWTQDAGIATGDLFYTVSQGTLTLAHHGMAYSAVAYDNSIANGSILPLVNTFNNSDGGFWSYAYVSDLIRAGWSYNHGYLDLIKIDGTYRFGWDGSAYYDWSESVFSRYPDGSIYWIGTAGCGFDEDWTYASTMRAALNNYAKTAPSQGPFTDVPMSNYAHQPIQWAVEQGITNGTSATAFSPDETCSVGHILTFLYRAAGEPAVSGSNPFSDVKSSDWFYKAALWAHAEGLVSGDKLDPNAPCTRAAAVTWMWQQAGSPSVSGSGFTDVPAGADYAAAVAWAVKNQVTTGTSATTFSPNDTTTRAQIVTFLYRAAH